MPNCPQALSAVEASVTVKLTLCLALLVIFASAVVAQSGRRVHKSTPAPVSTPEPTPTPKPTEKPKPALTFIVGMDRYGGLNTIRLNSYGTVLQSFSERLGKSRSVEVKTASSEMSRGDAIKSAKAEKETYVILLQLQSEQASMSGSSNLTVFIQYWVFAPTTAKVKTSGQTYPETYRNKSVILNPRSGSIYGDYQLQQAAREAADRVLDTFKIQASSDKLPGLSLGQ